MELPGPAIIFIFHNIEKKKKGTSISNMINDQNTIKETG